MTSAQLDSLIVSDVKIYFFQVKYRRLILVAARSKAWVCGHSPAEIVGSNPAGWWMSVSCDCCVLSDRGLCDELITRGVQLAVVRCCVRSRNIVKEEAKARVATQQHRNNKCIKKNWIKARERYPACSGMHVEGYEMGIERLKRTKAVKWNRTE